MLPRSEKGISPPCRMEGAASGDEPGTVLPHLGFFCGFRDFSPSLSFFKLPFENSFCLFPSVSAKLLSTKGVTK